MSAGDTFIIIGAVSLPTIGCWFGILAIRYSFFGLHPENQMLKMLKVFTLEFIYASAALGTIIYASLGYASYRVFVCIRSSGNGFDDAAKIALALYLVQLILYWAWLPIFVKFEPCYGVSGKLIEMCRMSFCLMKICHIFLYIQQLLILAAALSTAAACGFTFGQIDLSAGLIFLPYMASALVFSMCLSGMFVLNVIFRIFGATVAVWARNIK